MGIKERKEKAREEMRAAILRAAQRILASDGHESVTIREVAKSIEYSPRTLYLYFQDKDAILTELMKEAFGKLTKLLSTEVAAPPRERLIRFAEIYFRFAAEHPHEYRLMFHRALPAVRPRDEEEIPAFIILQRCIEDLLTSLGKPLSLATGTAVSCWALLHGFVTLEGLGHFGEITTKGGYELLADGLSVLIPGTELKKKGD